MVDRFELIENTRISDADSPPAECAEVLRPEECALALAEIQTWPGYHSTPLRSLPGMAQVAGIGELLYKDESGRFGLGSFKALGGAYAVYRYLVRELADWGAQMFGCPCVVFIHAHVSKAREAAITSFGARVVRISGNYDDSVERAADDAETHGWQVVSDTSYPGYTEVPREVMSGYAVMVDESIHALPAARPPTHVFVQGGVGGLAAVVCVNLWWKYGASRPRFIIVEPKNAACLYASAVAGKRVHIGSDLDTVMAGLSCGECGARCHAPPGSGGGW
jgi:diaminopropionate ammonia-lyase